MRTLKMKMDELLLQKSFAAISEKYKKGGDQGLYNHTIKLLLRCKKICEAKG